METDRERFKALCRFKSSLKDLEEIPILCDHCREKVKNQLKGIEEQIDKILASNNGVIL